MAELALTNTASRAVERGQCRARLRALLIPVIIIIVGLAVATLTPVSIEELVSIRAGSQVPVYILGLAGGSKIFPTVTRNWWLSVISTSAVSVLLIPAGLCLLVPATIALVITTRNDRPRSAPTHPMTRR